MKTNTCQYLKTLVLAVVLRVLLYSLVASLAPPYGNPATLVFTFGPFLQLCMIRIENLVIGVACLQSRTLGAKRSDNFNKRAFARKKKRPRVLQSVPSGRLFIMKQKRAYTLVNTLLLREINGIS